MLNKRREDTLVELCKNLIRYPSLSGQERKVASFVRETMLAMGYDSVDVDYYGSVTGRIVFGGRGKTLLMEAQIDQVEVADPSEWNYYPFGGFAAGGRIYGRGSTDQKGSLAAMILAGASLKEDACDRLSGELIVAGTVHQERFEGISSRLVASKYKPDLVVVGEASDLNVERGQRGRAEIILETLGKTAHSANPGLGVNAAMHMVFLLSEISRNFVPAVHPFLGSGILELTNISSFPEQNTGVVPGRCRALFDRRLLLGETKESILSGLEEMIDIAALKDPELRAYVGISKAADACYTGVPIKGEHFAPPWLLPEDHPFIKKALAGVGDGGVDGLLSEKAGFGTNGCYYGGELGIPTIVFGPSSEALAHIIDEYIEIGQLLKGFLGYYGIAGRVLSEYGT